MTRFIAVDRDTQFLFPPSVQEWLPEDHLARFIVDIVEQLDVSGLEQSYAGRGSDAHHPAMLVALLLYGYATGTFSSRALERASYDSIAFRYITANTHPDHDTINSFRKRFLKQIEAVFIQVLCYAQAMGMLKLGTVSLDGTKVHANASRHRAGLMVPAVDRRRPRHPLRSKSYRSREGSVLENRWRRNPDRI